MASPEDVGARIAQALGDAGMKPAELARRLKVSQPTVHAWVNGLHGITWANVRRVAAVLKVAPGWIMFGADEEAERLAQTPQELGFLRLFRELDDSDQASLLRLVTAMRRAPESPSGQPSRPSSATGPPRGAAAQHSVGGGCVLSLKKARK